MVNWLLFGWIRDEFFLLLWWLILFIEALVLSQILSGKGANNGQFERGQLVQLILTKAVFTRKRL